MVPLEGIIPSADSEKKHICHSKTKETGQGVCHVDS